MLSSLNMWNKVGRIIAMISRNLGIDVSKAVKMFYQSRTCADLHDSESGMYLMGDKYIYDSFIMELKAKSI